MEDDLGMLWVLLVFLGMGIGFIYILATWTYPAP